MEKVEVEGRDKLAGFCLRWLEGRDGRLRCAAAQVHEHPFPWPLLMYQ